MTPIPENWPNPRRRASEELVLGDLWIFGVVDLRRPAGDRENTSDDFLVGIGLEVCAHDAVEPLGEPDVVDGLALADVGPHGVKAARQGVDRLGQRNDAGDLREIGVGRAPGQKPQLLVAAVGVAIGECDPRPFAEALPQPTGLEQLLQRQGCPAFARDACVAGIGAGAGIFLPHGSATRPGRFGRVRLAALLMDHAPPIDVLKVTILTSADKPDRRGVALLPVGPEVNHPLRRIQVLEPHEPAAIGRFAGQRVACKPSREHCRADRGRGSLGILFVDRRRSELRRLVARDAIVVLQPQMQKALQPRLLDLLERPLALHLPLVEPEHEDGPVGKVEHRAGTEHPDQLAHAYRVICHGIARLNSGLGRRDR